MAQKRNTLTLAQKVAAGLRLHTEGFALSTKSFARNFLKIFRPRYGFTKGQHIHNEFVAISANRSVSDDGIYPAFVERANRDHKVFSEFKSDPDYRTVLEHVTKQQGRDYLNFIQKHSPEFIDQIDKFKINDMVGAPIMEFYPEIGKISPTTLRYIKVTSDLMKYFGGTIGTKVAEIGVGYGGQYLVLDQVFKMTRYELFDLPPVLSLMSKYLESHLLNSSYKACTLNQSDGTQEFDCVISNYAFSELPPSVQKKYIEKILSQAKRGYLTMNSGREESVFSNHLTLESLKQLLPPFEIKEEIPLTREGNYIILWGNN